MTNEPSNHIDPAVSWTDEATITLESASPFNAGASERSRPLCPSMNAAPILWSGANRFGRKARVGDGGALGGPGWSGAGVAAVRMSLPDTPGNERMHWLSQLKSYTTHHLSVGVGRSVALSNTHMLLNTHTHTHTRTRTHLGPVAPSNVTYYT